MGEYNGLHGKAHPVRNGVDRTGSSNVAKQAAPVVADPSKKRLKTFNYKAHLPYETEGVQKEQEILQEIIRQLYISIETTDWTPGATHWIRELKQWLGLKFNPTKEQRAKLVKLSYELALAPGMDNYVSERFASLFYILVKRRHYLRPVEDLVLDWRPLYNALKLLVLPQEPGLAQAYGMKRNPRTLTKLCSFAQLYFNPAEIPAMLEEILPYFNTSSIDGAFATVGLLNQMFPTSPPVNPDDRKLLPQSYLPSFFHLWAVVNRSKVFDSTFIDLLSRIAKDALRVEHVDFSEFGIFTQEQAVNIFTAALRLLEIPVGQSGSVYSSAIDHRVGLGMLLERDPKKHPVAHQIARWIVMSLSPACMEESMSIMSELEALIQAIETFFHPSNSGAWTKPLAQLVYYLTDFFVMRWNREASGEMEVPADRRLDDALKRRFVSCLQEVVFMGIYSKSNTTMSFFFAALHGLAFLEPSLIFPGALQRIYPSMQGLVEVHRTSSSLKALTALAPIMITQKGYRCHITTLLGLALPGIDANDLDKTFNTLSFLQNICHNIPFHSLGEADSPTGNSGLAIEWITGEMERMEQEGSNFKADYANDMTDEDEEAILKSSTAGLNEFLGSFLGRVFTLLENLPDTTRASSGSPEHTVINQLPAAFTPMLASLSPDLFDFALNKVADFIGGHVVYQARDAMAFICNSFCKVNPQKTLKRLIPMLVSSIRTEIEENGAASTRNAGSEALPRDRALIWHISILSMTVVYVGEAVLEHKDELIDIAMFMQKRCRGTPTIHVSNCIHHLLLNLTSTYPVDVASYERDTFARGLRPSDWGAMVPPEDLNIKWHVPSKAEIDFGFQLFKSQTEEGIRSIRALLDGSSGLKKESKPWSDDLTRDLNLLRLLNSGVATLYDVDKAFLDEEASSEANGTGGKDIDMLDEEEEEDELLAATDSEEGRPRFTYEAGYSLEKGDPIYEEIHSIRETIGKVLHEVHEYLVTEKEDDVTCLSILCSAFKYWMSDVGVEKTAHHLDRVTRVYATDIGPYKIAGLRKRYPRAVLLRRAYVYHLSRQRYNSQPRPASKLDKTIIRDLARSSVSTYTEVRQHSQSALESACKALRGARQLLVPDILQGFEEAVKAEKLEQTKGSIYLLVLGVLAKNIGRDWRYTPRLIKTYLEACDIDNITMQKICSSATFPIMDFSRQRIYEAYFERSLLVDLDVDELDQGTKKDMEQTRRKLHKRRELMDSKKRQLADDLVEMTKVAHWKTASRIAAIIVSLGFRFKTLMSSSLAGLLANGSVDVHPGLRGLYSSAFGALMALVQTRAACEHSEEKNILNQDIMPGRTTVKTRRGEKGYTEKFLDDFSKPAEDHFLDHRHVGWLIWIDEYAAIDVDTVGTLEYDEVEDKVVNEIGRVLDRQWFANFFKYMLQEPRDASADKFRTQTSYMLTYLFDFVVEGRCATTFEDLKEEIETAYGDGSTKHQHRTLAEILSALASAVYTGSTELRNKIWSYIMPKLTKIFQEELTPENHSYWLDFVLILFRAKDPRRSWPLLRWLSDFRLDMASNAAFKEAAKFRLLETCMQESGWHYQLEKPILKDFLDHLDHPYKAVRESIGASMAIIYRTRYHESYPNLAAFIRHQNQSSSLGSRPWQPTEEFSSTMKEVFGRLEKWRQEHEPGQQTPSSYTSGSKTVLIWLDAMLSSEECALLQPFFADYMLEPLLHMMDVKDDTELQALAYHVFRQIPNVPSRSSDDDDALLKGMIRIGRTSPFWHQRLRVMVNMQVFYFRRLFLLSDAQQQALYDCVSDMLADTQLEVRVGASATLSGMIRCSRAALRDRVVQALIKRFTSMLLKNPLPKRPNMPRLPSGMNTPTTGTGTSTPNPEHTRLVLTRHAAVLGLGALVQAFPYTSPPPAWVPNVLTTLANKANNDPGVVGKGVKSILADFKKTRQDTWQMDLKVFSPEQVEDLEGVLWKSYFA